VWPNSVATSSAVSLSITSLIFSIMPWRIMNLMISTPRTAIRLDSSCTVMTSGITTSRLTAACSTPPPRRFSFSRSRARRTEARLRIRSAASSSPATAWMVRRPSRRFGAPLARLTALSSSPGPLLRRASPGRLKGVRGPDRDGRSTSGPSGAEEPTPGPRGPPGRAPGPAGRGLRAEYRTVSPGAPGRAP
jgi:hypothetical protein